MKSCNEILNTITSRFPKHQETIRELYEKSNSFQSLCKDYYDCKIVLDRVNCFRTGSEIIRMEYKVILQEIEQELISSIILNEE